MEKKNRRKRSGKKYSNKKGIKKSDMKIGLKLKELVISKREEEKSKHVLLKLLTGNVWCEVS